MTEAGEPDLSSVESPPQRELTYTNIAPSAEQLIGEGGQARVYEVTLDGPEPPTRVAIKEPLGTKTLDTTAIERFLSEAETWARLDELERRKPRWQEYEHIVGLVDTGEDLPWIAMEFMDGGTLADRLAESPNGLPLEEALWIGECICRGLEIAHSYGIAHLDLKPENVLFRSAENGWDVPKIADWGLARVLFEHSGSMDALSVRFGAPEQFEPDEFGDPDELSDVYQAGAIVYALLTGEPPYTGSRLSLMRNVLDPEPPEAPSERREDIPEVVDSIVRKALATEKRDRPAAITDLRRVLRTVRTGEDASLSVLGIGRTTQPRRSPADENGEPSSGESDPGTEESTGDSSDTADPTEPTVADDRSDDAIDEEPVTEVPGIGETYAEELSRAGIKTVEDLAAVETDALSDRVQIPPRRLANAAWKASQEASFPSLLDVRGIGETYAEWLLEAEIGTVTDLAAADAETLREADHITRGDPKRWIQNARKKLDKATENGDERIGFDPKERDRGSDLTEVSGIGPAYAETLAEQGIESIEALAETTPRSLADLDGASLARATRWVEQARDEIETDSGLADVTQIRGVGSIYADRLAEAGILGVFDLVSTDPEVVAEAAEVDESTAGDWIRRARQHLLETDEDAPDDLTAIPEIGDTRARELESASIETPASLIGSKPRSVADRTSLSRRQIGSLIENALDTVGIDGDPIEELSTEGSLPSSLTDIRGIGAERAGKLHRAGIESPADLVDADPEHVGKKTGLSSNVVRKLASRAEHDPFRE